jgi:ATP-dependent Clp protease ATP-binding subunit ClpC
VGYDESGQLTEKVRRNPYSVVLFDEIEKAHPDIFNMLLQVLDDGRLTDGQGRTVDFRNTVVIMTSNVGSEFLASKSGAMGFVAGGGDGFGNENEIRTRVMSRLREVMRPEFLNRIDEIVLFKKLEITEVKQIARLLMVETEARLATQGIVMSVPDEAVVWIANNGYDAQYGARPLRRLIQRRVEDAISDLIINEEVTAGDSIILKVVDGDLKVIPERQAFKPSKAKKPVTV